MSGRTGAGAVLTFGVAVPRPTCLYVNLVRIRRGLAQRCEREGSAVQTFMWSAITDVSYHLSLRVSRNIPSGDRAIVARALASMKLMRRPTDLARGRDHG